MDKLNQKQQWEAMIGFYQELIDRSGWPIECMSELVSEILVSRVSQKYFPSTSHASLGISAEGEYKHRLEKPMVYISCDDKLENFNVSFQHGQGNTLHTQLFSISNVQQMLRSVEGWLDNA